MKNFHFVLFILILSGFNSTYSTNKPPPKLPIYQMKTAKIINGELIFKHKADFDEAVRVGFFRIKRPQEININATREFAKNFTKNPKYTKFGILDAVNGYIKSERAQTIRFEMERDYWDKEKWGSKPSKDNPNLPKEVQKVGHQLKEVGVTTLKAILKKFDIPQDLWFKATSGATHDEGSYYLLFNYYDPKNAHKPEGLGAHTDWGALTVLDAVEEGLEAEINGHWHHLKLEDGYLTINFGKLLQKLLPGAKACKHRVALQKDKVRTSTIMFINQRVGPYRKSSGLHTAEVGMVWDWDPATNKLTNGKPTTEYFQKRSDKLYGRIS